MCHGCYTRWERRDARVPDHLYRELREDPERFYNLAWEVVDEMKDNEGESGLFHLSSFGAQVILYLLALEDGELAR